jgi:hypothetical protein
MRLFGPKRDGVTGEWRKLFNEELHNLYSSSSIIRMIKTRRMKCTGHVARMERRGRHIKMPSFDMLQPLPLVRIDVSQESMTSIILVNRISELGTTFALTRNF